MSIEESIVKRIRESREQSVETYKNCRITIDYDNIYHVYSKRGKVGEFESYRAAIEYIDDLPNNERNASRTSYSNSREKMYVIYVSNTDRGRGQKATYLSKSKKYINCYEKDADKFSEKEKNAIMKNSRNLAFREV